MHGWCFPHRGMTTSLRSSVSCTGSRRWGGGANYIDLKFAVLVYSAFMEQHRRTMLMNSASRGISARDVAFVQHSHHHWSSAELRACQPSATELFPLAFPVAAAHVWIGTVVPQHVTSAPSLSSFRRHLKTAPVPAMLLLTVLCHAWAVTVISCYYY